MSIYQVSALCQAFQKHHPVYVVLRATPERCSCPHFKEKTTEVPRDHMFTQGHETPSGQARCELRSVGFRACGHPQISLAVRIPQATISWLFCLKKLRTSHADNYLLLSTWTSCPFIGKGNDFWLHPVSPQPPALPTETERPIHHWGPAHLPPYCRISSDPRFCWEQRQLCSRSFPPPQLPSSPTTLLPLPR